MRDSRITIRRVDGCADVLKLDGDHDLAGLATLRASLDGIGELPVVFDLSGATFIDSTVVGVITRASADGVLRGRVKDVRIVAPTGTLPRRVLDLVGVPDQVPTFEDVEAALAWQAAQPSASAPDQA